MERDFFPFFHFLQRFRGEEWHKEECLQKLKTLDDMVIDMSLNWEKFVGKYREEYDVE